MNQALRRIRTDPKTALMAILILAVAIGLNVSFFTVVQSVLLRALPYRAPQELALLSSYNDWAPRGLRVSGPDFIAFRQRLRSFSQLEAVRFAPVRLRDGRLNQEETAVEVTPGFFPMLGVAAQAGRLLGEGDQPEQSQPVVVLSSRFAQSRFGSAAEAVGKSVQLSERPYTIIGVLPEDFRFFFYSQPRDFWLPTSYQELSNFSRQSRGLEVIGRLRGPAGLEEARREAEEVAASLAAEYPQSNQGTGAHIDPMHEQRLGHMDFPFKVLGAGLALILLIGCANASALLLSKGTAFRSEFAIRLALGARRRQLAGHSMSYALMLALLGGLAGLLLASSAVGLLQTLLPADIPRADQIRIDGWVMAFVLGVSLLAGLLLGLFPALISTRLTAAEALSTAWGGASGLPKESRWLGGILAAQAALAVMLAIGAFLLIQSYWIAAGLDPGFEWENVLTVDMELPRDLNRIPPLLEDLEAQLGSLEPVRGFGWNLSVPYTGSGMRINFWTDRQAAPPPGEEPSVQAGAIYGDYFKTMGIPLLAGRPFEAQDALGAQPVCIVNRSFASRHWPDGQAVGRQVHFRRLRDETTRIVVGVVGDVKQRSPVSDWIEKVYIPFAQMPQFYGTIVLKTEQASQTLLTAVKERIAQAAPDATVGAISTLEESLADLLAERLFFTRLFTLLALSGLLLVLAGVASLVQFSISRRIREMGVRVALGARPRNILWISLRASLLFTLAGSLAGLAGAYGLTHYLSTWLYELTPTDAASYATVCALMAVTALVAAALSARRALRLDPVEALRCQ